ncbi:MAG: EscN/YscN/HrcN family type III secretion system ATPase, partial [Clostridium sp.]
MINIDFSMLNKKIRELETTYSEGVVKQVIGLTIEVQGVQAFVGELCTIYNLDNKPVNCEVVGFREDAVLLMPLGELIGIAPGCRVIPEKRPLEVKCSNDLLG